MSWEGQAQSEPQTMTEERLEEVSKESAETQQVREVAAGEAADRTPEDDGEEDALDEGRIFEVERLVDIRELFPGEIDYRVRWKNYPPEEDSWESKEQLLENECGDLINQFHSAIQRPETSDEIPPYTMVATGPGGEKYKMVCPYAFMEAVGLHKNTARRSISLGRPVGNWTFCEVSAEERLQYHVNPEYLRLSSDPDVGRATNQVSVKEQKVDASVIISRVGEQEEDDGDISVVHSTVETKRRRRMQPDHPRIKNTMKTSDQFKARIGEIEVSRARQRRSVLAKYKQLHDLSLEREKLPVNCPVAIVPDFAYIAHGWFLADKVSVEYDVASLHCCGGNRCDPLKYHPPIGEIGDRHCLRYECTVKCRCEMQECSFREVQRGMKHKLRVEKRQNNDLSFRAAVLADSFIPKHSFVAEFTGALVSESDAFNASKDSPLLFLLATLEETFTEEVASNWFKQLQETRVDDEESSRRPFAIDGENYSSVARYFGHSDTDFNLVPVRILYEHSDKRAPFIAFFSTRNIFRHEELLYNKTRHLANGDSLVRCCFADS